MGVRFACHGCAEPLNIKQELAGRRGVCPKCGIRFRIPQFDAPVSTPLENEAVMASRSTGQAARKNAGARAAGGSPQVASRANGGVVVGVAAANVPASIDPLGDASISTWYVRPPSGGQYGPATTDVLRQWISEGRVSATALLWREGWAQWREAREILSGLAGESAPVSAPFAATAEVTTAGRAAATSSHAADGTVSEEVIGNAEIGKQRRERSLKRIFTIGALSLVSLTLIIALVAVVRSSG
jgi:GYF domain 2